MTLEEFLIEAYGEYGRPHRSSLTGKIDFSIDDHSADDVSSSFCNISIALTDPESNDFQLTLYPVPWDEDVEILANTLHGEWKDIPTGRVLSLPMTIRSVPNIRKLARAIRKVIGRGRTYVDSNWKWSARRTADSLERFARLLSDWNRNGRNMVAEEGGFMSPPAAIDDDMDIFARLAMG